jgi:hypothetical protein
MSGDEPAPVQMSGARASIFGNFTGNSYYTLVSGVIASKNKCNHEFGQEVQQQVSSAAVDPGYINAIKN